MSPTEISTVMKKIVVVTPVKNEEWILGAFLDACSKFADHILIADQGSWDSSREIASKFTKARVIENEGQDYNEKERAELLIEQARFLEGDNIVIIALDADEIPVTDAKALDEWEIIRGLKAGTSIRFQKPDILEGGKEMVFNIPDGAPLGFIDDAGPFEGRLIHTQRVPIREDLDVYFAKNIILYHVNLVRPKALRAKRRMYCVLENLNKTQPLWRRCCMYSRKNDFSCTGERIPISTNISSFFDDIGINLESIDDENLKWQDYATLRMLNIHGFRRFFFDDVWDADWENVKAACLAEGWPGVDGSVKSPSLITGLLRESFRLIVLLLLRIKKIGS